MWTYATLRQTLNFARWLSGPAVLGYKVPLSFIVVIGGIIVMSETSFYANYRFLPSLLFLNPLREHARMKRVDCDSQVLQDSSAKASKRGTFEEIRA